MMYDFVAQLWNGALTPITHFGKSVPEIKHLEELICKNREKLEHILLATQKETLEKWEDCTDEYIGLICEQAFCDGFALGTKIVTEALYNAEGLKD